MKRRPFTVDQANGLIPHLEVVLARVRALADDAASARDRLAILDVLWGEAVGEPDNPDHAEFLALKGTLIHSADAVRKLVHDEVEQKGIRFPVGGIQHGLLDFPTVYQGRWVYLCWRSGEPELSAWHEVDGGFAGRQEITEEQRSLMGRQAGGQVDDSVLDF